jgi:hypothetical protein
MVQPLFPIGYLSNSGETVAEMQSNFEAMNVQFENSFANCVLSNFTGYTSSGLTVTFGLGSTAFFVAIQGGLQYFIPYGDPRTERVNDFETLFRNYFQCRRFANCSGRHDDCVGLPSRRVPA